MPQRNRKREEVPRSCGQMRSCVIVLEHLQSVIQRHGKNLSLEAERLGFASGLSSSVFLRKTSNLSDFQFPCGPCGCESPAPRNSQVLLLGWNHKHRTQLVCTHNVVKPQLQIKRGKICMNVLHEHLHLKQLKHFWRGQDLDLLIYYVWRDTLAGALHRTPSYCGPTRAHGS